ncbi:MAG: formate/nitrite transporter family protein [Flavobacteriaceae bacterium]|jgi:formate/nitrite transporter|nr:formate/nitrite transporter family protein [Flavobacteriaceae bacterium]
MSNYFPPQKIAEQISFSGISKAKMPISKFIFLAILGGVYISFGGLMFLLVAGGMPELTETNPGLAKFLSAAMFPIGLILIVIAGGDLFTSDCATMVFPAMQKSIKPKYLLRVWGLSYIFNFVGTIIIAYFFAYKVGFINTSPWKEYLHKLAFAKTHTDFFTAFIKGVGANWLVCIGVWMGFAAKDITGKIIGIWMPIMLFVAMGYEHSIANMFFIPTAIFSGANITWAEFFVNNLLPVTIGNIVGGAVFVGCLYWYIYLKKQ